jgi:hypothetical protein
MREWLPEDDLVFVVLDAVVTVDLGAFRRSYQSDGHGRAAYEPEMRASPPRQGRLQTSAAKPCNRSSDKSRPAKKLTTMSRRGVQQRVAARRRRPQPAQAAFAPMQQLTEERQRKPMITIGPAGFPPPTFPGLPQTVYATGSRMHSAIPVHQLGMSGVRPQVASSTALCGSLQQRPNGQLLGVARCVTVA